MSKTWKIATYLMLNAPLFFVFFYFCANALDYVDPSGNISYPAILFTFGMLYLLLDFLIIKLVRIYSAFTVFITIVEIMVLLFILIYFSYTLH